MTGGLHSKLPLPLYRHPLLMAVPMQPRVSTTVAQPTLLPLVQVSQRRASQRCHVDQMAALFCRKALRRTLMDHPVPG